MLDTATITVAITRLVATGASEQALLAAVAYLFSDLTPAELSAPWPALRGYKPSALASIGSARRLRGWRAVIGAARRAAGR